MKKNLPDLTEHNNNGVQFDIAYATPAYNHLQTYSVDLSFVNHSHSSSEQYTPVRYQSDLADAPYIGFLL